MPSGLLLKPDRLPWRHAVERDQGKCGGFPQGGFVQFMGPWTALPQCSQHRRFCAVRLAQRTFGCLFMQTDCFITVVMGPPQSRQNDEPARTGLGVAIVFSLLAPRAQGTSVCRL